MTTWTEAGRRAILLKGKVWVEQGVVHVRMREGVVWVDEEAKRRTGIFRVDIYGEGDVSVEDGPKALEGNRGLLDLSTRGEVRLKAYQSKVRQVPDMQNPLYLRAQTARYPQTTAAPRAPAVPAGPIQRTSYQEPPPPGQPPGAAVPGQPSPRPRLDWPPADPPGAAPPSPGPPTLPIGPSPNPQPPAAPPPGPPVRPPEAVRPAPPPPPAPRPPDAPPRQISIVPRTSAPIQSQSFPLENGETAIVVTSGVILTVRSAEDKVGLVDIEADRLVFWTRGDTQKIFNNLRTPQGESSRQLEFYLAGNVEIRQQAGKEIRLLRADEVFYDASRHTAIALRADLEVPLPGLPDPLHLRAQEIQELSTTQFRALGAQVFSSHLPSDPGLKVESAEATLEEKRVPRRSIFGRQVYDRVTGQPEYETQQLFDGRDVVFRVEDVPVFYLPFLRGDANEPLGPLRSVSFNYNRIYGFQTQTTFNVYELIGVDRIPGTNWDLHADYLTERGPALGTTYDYAGKDMLGIPNVYVGQVKAYGIYDTGTDILGGGRGELDHHPDWRGRFFWRQAVEDLPDGFSVKAQVSALSDKNFLEQYYKLEFDREPNQETYLYVKQQQNNWAWTVLTEPNIRRWVDETEWLPRVDGYLLGQSFFDRLTYNARANVAYAHLLPTQVPPPPEDLTTRDVATGRFDLWQDISLPFYLGPVKVVPYGVVDTTYYTEDLTGSDRGRLYGGGGVRASLPLTRLYPDVHSLLFNVNGINHKIVLSANYYVAKSDTPFTQLPQLDRINDDATDQAIRDIRPREPFLNPQNGLFLATSPLFDPQLYAIRRLVLDRVDTLDSINELELDIRQRWQTKRGYPGQEHIVDWMTLDLSASVFPQANRDNFGEALAFLEYDWTWNIGDRTALVSTGWFDPVDKGPRVFTFGAFLNRPDRTNFFVGYRELYPVNSQAVTAAVSYVFSPKYAVTASSTYDFGTNQSLSNVLTLTRMGSDLQVSLG
jgi:hypothetical protein